MQNNSSASNPPDHEAQVFVEIRFLREKLAEAHAVAARQAQALRLAKSVLRENNLETAIRDINEMLGVLPEVQ